MMDLFYDCTKIGNGESGSRNWRVGNNGISTGKSRNLGENLKSLSTYELS